MKRETLRHPKMFDLASRLGCSRPEALGFLILLWDFTADQAIQGNIGKWSDGAIARACDWKGDESSFVEAMVDSGWIDDDDKHRLLVHDWSDHCERWVKAKLERLRLSFAERSTVPSDVPQERSTEPSTVSTTEPSSPRDQSNPIQTKPNPVVVEQKFEETPEGLTNAWRFYAVSARALDRDDDWEAATKTFAELIRHGKDCKAMLADIESKTRDRAEKLWTFKARWNPPNTRPQSREPPRLPNVTKQRLDREREANAGKNAPAAAQQGSGNVGVGVVPAG